jgi:hypothetical protein
MANATININAVDNTRGAFLSVRRSMTDTARQLNINQQGVAALAKRYIGFGVVVGGVSKLLKDVAENAQEIRGLRPEVAGSVVSLKNSLVEVTGEFGNFVKKWAATGLAGLADISTEAGRQISVMLGYLDRADLANDRAKDTARDLAALNAAVYDSEQIKRAQQELEAFRKTSNDAAIKLNDMGLGLNLAFGVSATRTIPEMRENIKRLDDQLQVTLRNLRDLKGNTTLSGPELQDAIVTELNTEKKLRQELVTEAERLMRAEANRAKVSKEAGKILAGGFEEAVFSGKKLSEVINQLGQDILRMMFRNMITEPLANFFSGGLKSIFGYADGGLPPTGRPSIVGERGPELFVPGTSGRIVPNHELTGGGKGGGATYYIDARGADQTGLARLEGMIRETQASIRPIALSSVMDARMRRPSFA